MIDIAKVVHISAVFEFCNVAVAGLGWGPNGSRDHLIKTVNSATDVNHQLLLSFHLFRGPSFFLGCRR